VRRATDFRLVLVLAVAAPAASGETVRVELNGATTPVADELRPGLFYNNTTSNANRVFDTCGIRCNMMRDGDLAWCLMSSTSYEDAMSDIRNLRTLHQHRAGLTDRFVTHVSGMPWWLSRSSDTSRIGGNWRYFNSVGPRDYAVWDSLIRDIAAEVSTWGYAPWYEFWNEPDLFYWNGTEAELIGLYRHTANAIKTADPDARVGGFAVNYWHKGIDSNMPDVYGWIPDSLIRRYAATAHLIDSCALAGTPLDFVSWHMFSAYPQHVDQAADFFRRQLDSAGLFATELLMTEYNASGSLRERPVHPGMTVRFNERMAARSVRHAVASYQDFSSDPTREFFGDYGLLSRGALCKPAFKALQLLNEVTLLGRLLPVELQTDCRLTVLVSRQGDKVRVFLANSFLPPLSDGYDALLWNGEHRISTEDLWAEGYTWATIESTIKGVYPPHGRPEVVAAFEDANRAYGWAQQYYYLPRTVELRLAGLADTCRGTIAVLDTFTNNVVLRYDSLIAAGWTRQAAVSYLYSDQDTRRDSIVVADSVFELTLRPNAVVLLALDGVRTADIAEPRRPGAPGAQSPATVARGVLKMPREMTGIRPGIPDRLRRPMLLDAAGRKVMDLQAGANDVRSLAAGVYFVREGDSRIRSVEGARVTKVVVAN